MNETLMYTFEGLDGCGKTTNIKEIKSYFEGLGLATTICISPSRSSLGQFIRENFRQLDPWLKDRLFILDMENSLRAIPEGSNLILWDRYIDSLYSSNNETKLEDIELLTFGLPSPYRTFLLDISPEISLEREGKVHNHPLDMDWLLMKHLRYQILSEKYSERFFKVDASKSFSIVQEVLINHIKQDVETLVKNKRGAIAKDKGGVLEYMDGIYYKNIR